MPKFLTYQRPAPVNKQHWNGGSKQQPLPRKTPAEPRLATPPALAGLDQLPKKD